MTESKEIPWRKRDIIPQMVFFALAISFASITLFLLNWILILIYCVLWVSFFILNHRYVCRDCKYCGTLCGSFGLGKFSLFKRTEKEHFNHKKAKKCIILLLIIIAYPLVLFLIIPPFHWIWALIYFGLVFIAFILHQRLGCAKCDLTHCSSNPQHKKTMKKE